MSEPLADLFNACNPMIPATSEFYVDCTDVRGSDAFIDQVLNELSMSNEWLRFLFSGHIGGGKSSELERLRESLERPGATGGRRFLPILIDAGVYLNEYDVAPIDILLSIVAEVADTLRAVAGIELRDSFLTRRLNELWKTLSGNVEINEAEIPLWGLKAKVTLLKQSPTARETVRARLAPQTATILGEINFVLEEARSQLRKKADAGDPYAHTDLVLILDNLEKIKRIGGKEGEASEQYLFIECAPQLSGLDAHVIYTVPLRLVRSHGPQLNVLYGVQPFVLPMIKIEEPGTHDPYQKGRDRLVQMLQKRAGMTPLNQIFEQAALDWLLTYSGGHVRELMGFVRQACSMVKSFPIDLAAAQQSLNRSIGLYSTSIPFPFWDKLAALELSPDQQFDNSDPDSRRLLELLAVLEYRNGVPWYAVHPIVRQLPRFKSALAKLKLEKEE